MVPRLLVLALALAAWAPARASVTVIGGGLGRECYMAAELKREPRIGIATCNRALADEAQTRRDRAATLVNRGILYMRDRDIERAIADYRSAIALEPRLAEAHVNYGIALVHLGGQDREAVAVLTRGLELGPARPEVALYTRAVAHELLGDLRAAFDDYAAAAEARPDWAEPREQLKRFEIRRGPVGRG